VKNRIVTALYNLGVLLIATGTFKDGIEFTTGIGIGIFCMVWGFLMDLIAKNN